MEEEKILENITKSISDRLKVPIILTYISVLIIHNWDILYYLFFQAEVANAKIDYIKKNYSEFYYPRIINSLIIAVVLIIVFTVLNTAINFCLKWFYRKDKEIKAEIESFEQISKLTEQLSTSIDEIKRLKEQVENLKKINVNLSTNTKLDVKEISKIDYNNLISHLNTKPNKEKLLFSLKELLLMFKNDDKESQSMIFAKATYTHEMRELVQILIDRKLIEETHYSGKGYSSYSGFKIGTSFKDFLKMEV